MFKTVTLPAYWLVSGKINLNGKTSSFKNHKVSGKVREVEAIESYRSRVAGLCKNVSGTYTITEIVTRFVPENVVEYDDDET